MTELDALCFFLLGMVAGMAFQASARAFGHWLARKDVRHAERENIRRILRQSDYINHRDL
jgi:uncharacterized membrane protein